MGKPQTPTETQPRELQPGTVLDEFRIERKIGEGGMARLYLAVNLEGQYKVLKVPRQSYGIDPVCVVSLENEMRLAPYLEDFPHAHMPEARGAASGGYLVMDYIQGVDLLTHLREAGFLSEEEAVSLIRKIVLAMSELHQRRILHLDLKLSNVMITSDGNIRLVDFGLANHLDLPDLIYESFPEPKGTPAYIAPEQFIGVRDDPRSDIFSIGTMLYEMTTGKLPFPDARTEWGVVQRIRSGVTPPRKYNPAFSDAFEVLVLNCLRTNPDERFNSMEELYETLGLWEQEIPIQGIIKFAPRDDAPPERPSVTAALKRVSRLIPRFWEKDRDDFERLKRWADDRVKSETERPFRVLVAIDLGQDASSRELNERVVRHAFELVRGRHSFITVMTAVTEDTGLSGPEKEMKVYNEACIQARKAIKGLIGAAGGDGAPVGINVRKGDVVEAVTGCIRDYKADLLVVGGSRRGALSRFILGSTAYKILTSVRCNVYVVH